ncbi:MAG: response regulator [bacterium]
MKGKIRILLADDHEVVRDGLRVLLEKQPDFEVIGMSGDGRETIRMTQQLAPDLVILDINMPNLSGIEAARRIRAGTPAVKILTLSVHSRSALVARMIQAGASGYLPKSCAAQELIEAIRTVMRNHTYISPKIMDSVVEYLRTEPAARAVPAAELSGREREVLGLIAAGKSSKEIAACLNLSERTIEFHRHNLMDKLGLHTVADLTKYAVREGLAPLDDA